LHNAHYAVKLTDEKSASFNALHISSSKCSKSFGSKSQTRPNAADNSALQTPYLDPGRPGREERVESGGEITPLTSKSQLL